jgi:ADP-L-glycero-D-manno-heptose 6-epimerase
MRTGKITLFKSHRPDYADGEQKRDFLYIKDAVEMTLHLGFNPVPGGLYNLGSGEAHTWNTLARAIFAALNRVPAIDYLPMPEVLREKYQYFTQADIAKLRASGYLHTVTPVPEAVGDYVKTYLGADDRLAAKSRKA